MDMNTAFDLEVKATLPAGGGGLRPVPRGGSRYGREVVDRCEMEQANALKSDKPARKVVKVRVGFAARNRAKLSENRM